MIRQSIALILALIFSLLIFTGIAHWISPSTSDSSASQPIEPIAVMAFQSPVVEASPSASNSLEKPNLPNMARIQALVDQSIVQLKRPPLKKRKQPHKTPAPKSIKPRQQKDQEKISIKVKVREKSSEIQNAAHSTGQNNFPIIAPQKGSNVAAINAQHSSNKVQPLRRVEPDYPLKARRRKVEGMVRVKFSIDEAGKTFDIHIIEATPPRYFESSVIRAVQQWRYPIGTAPQSVKLVFALR